MVLNILDIKDELQTFLRNADIISISNRCVSTTTEEFDGTGSEETYTLTNSGLKNIRSVTVDGSPIDFGTDYTVDYENNQVTLTAASGTDNVDITYDYGTGDKIYQDYPRTDLNLDSYPRVGFGIVSNNSEDIDIQRRVIQNRIIIQIVVYSDSTSEIETIMYNIRNALFSSRKSFYNIEYLSFLSEGPLIVFNPDLKGQKIFQRNLDIVLPIELEISS